MGMEQMRKQKKKKRGPNKWMPFRRSPEQEKSAPKPAEKSSKKEAKSKKMKNKSFLESSDDDNEVKKTAHVEAESMQVGEGEGEVKSKEFLDTSSDENDENADPENKENQPVKPVPAVAKPVKS